MTEELLPFCECGCGLRVTKSGNRFIHGHHQRGVKHSPECNARQSERMIGHVVSDETRAAMSAARTGISPSQKHRAALSESLKNSDAAKVAADKRLGGNDIVKHHFIYDHNNPNQHTVEVTRSDHQSHHLWMRRNGLEVPHVNVTEENKDIFNR